MAPQLKLIPKPAHRLGLTPALKQSLHLLQLPLTELNEFLEAQIEENPLLEAAGEKDSLASLESLPEYKP